MREFNYKCGILVISPGKVWLDFILNAAFSEWAVDYLVCAPDCSAVARIHPLGNLAESTLVVGKVISGKQLCRMGFVSALQQGRDLTMQNPSA